MAAVEVGAKYTLIGPSGTAAVFNDVTDPNYVGMLTEITGFDSPDVRESADEYVQADGGVHGDFFYGRRPVTLSGILLNPASAADRNARQNKLASATDAMRGDAVLDWTNSGGAHQFIRLRRQQPLRVTGTWQKEFQAAMVAADPRIYSYALNSNSVNLSSASPDYGFAFDEAFDLDFGPGVVFGQLLVTNAGTAESWPTLTITGPVTNPTISNVTVGKSVRLIYTLAAGETMVMDALNRTIMLGGTSSRYGSLDFLASAWWPLVGGVNDVRLSAYSFGTGASLRVDWRDAWL